MAYYRAMGRGLFEEAEHMNTFYINDINAPVDVLDTFGDPTFPGKVTYKQPAMLQWEGMYWLVPVEILKECATALKQRKQFEGAYSELPPVLIGIHQCILIPSETAKILAEL